MRSLLYPKADPEQAAQQLQQTAIAQPAIFVIEYALAKLWMSWGIKPLAAIGHSIGEYVAATIAGVFSLEDALALVTTRGQLMQQLPSGSMLAIPLSSAEIQPLLNEHLSLAVINGTSNCVVSGTNEAIATLQDCLATEGIDCRRLHTSHAFHSAMIEPILEPFRDRVSQVKLNPPQIPYISNVTGTWITVEDATNPDYWTAHLRQTVRFAEGLQELFKQPDHVLLEVGAGRTLSKLAKQHADKPSQQVVLNSIRHPQEQQSDVRFLLNTLGQLWLAGVQIDWSRFYGNEKRDRIPLPTYPFERQRYWIELSQPSKLDSGLEVRDWEKNDFARTTSKNWDSLVEVGKNQQILASDIKNYSDNQKLLDDLAIAYINLALRQNGAFSNAEDRYTFEELAQQCQVIHRYQPLLARWLQMLLEKGQLQKEKEKFVNLSGSIKSVEALLEQIEDNWADSPKMLDLVGNCGENLAEVITGKQQPLQFFKGLLYDFDENKIDQKFFQSDRHTAIIKAIVSRVASSKTDLKVLEIASGVSYATEELISVLPSSQTNYTFADVGGSFLNEAKQKFSQYPFIECRALNLNRPLSEQKYAPGSFDVIVAVKSLHTAKNIEVTLDNIRFLLAPGGILLIWEKTQTTLDFEITWALLIEPSKNRLDSPYLSEKQWQTALYNSKFVEVTAFPETEAMGEHILLAQASAESSNSRQISPVSSSKKQDIADWFYVPSWKRSVLPQLRQTHSKQSESWLVFVDESGLGEQILKQLEVEGQNVIAVQIGEKFSYQGKSSQNQGIYTINPQNKKDYEALIEELLDLNWTPTKILHLWSVTPQERREIQTTGLYSLLWLVQTLAKHDLIDLEIAVVSNNLQSVTGEEAIASAKATILGAVKTIPLEYPNISCRSIDVSFSTSSGEKLVEQLLTELSTPSSNEVIAYRGKHRWVQIFDPVRLERVENTPQLREGGIYLITGGLGGIGLVMAKYLAQIRAKLVLCGRSEFPHRSQWKQWLTFHEDNNSVSEKIRQVRALEALGAEVLVMSADVSDRLSMQALVDRVRDRFGEINGIIHAAGVAIPGKIESRSRETVESVLAAKVKGVLVLEEIFQDTPLDFMALFSSLSSLSGGYAVDYVAANAFLDAYAHYCSAKDNSFTVAINWDNWQEVGMASQMKVPEELKPFYRENQKNSITEEEGIEAFKRILNYRLPQVVVTGRDLENAIAQHHSAKAFERQAEVTSTQQFYPRPQLANAYISPSNSTEEILTDLWQQLLGIEKVGIYDNFFELGGDSILSFQVALKAKENGLQLKPNQLFEHPTIADLAKVAAIETTEEAETNEPKDTAESNSKYTANLSPNELNKLLTKIGNKQK